MIRAVLDANVVVSALIRPKGPPGRIIAHVALGTFELVLLPATSSEIRRTVDYPKVRRRIPLTDEELELWLLALEVLAVRVEPRRHVRVVHEDPEDDIYIEAALEGLASCIVTGDDHLLRVGAFEGIQIVRPAQFLAMIRENAD